MSASNTAEEVEDMEVDSNDPQPSTSQDVSAEASKALPQNNEEAQVTLMVKWSGDAAPQKSKFELEKVLQTWANNIDKFEGDCRVLHVSDDGSVYISLKPAPAISELQKLAGQKLICKDGREVTVMSVSLTPPDLKTQTPDDASVNRPPSTSEPKAEQAQPADQISNVSTAGEETCTLPVPQFWYMNHIFKEEIERIERENGVEITGEVKVTFRAAQKDVDQQKALSEFTNLVQKNLGETTGSTVSLKNVDPEELKNTLKIAQKKENKLLLTFASEELIVFGPIESHNAFKKSLNVTTGTVTSVGESTWASQDTSLIIGMDIRDPLVKTGLTMDESKWKLMNTSYKQQVDKIKTKFGVDLKESVVSQGKVEVKACYKKPGGNASMESHAVRALLHLHQRLATSPLNFTQQHGATWTTDPQPEGASGGSAFNGQSGYNAEAPKEGGATAGDEKDDECPICRDKFVNKKQLKCKHEFCEECLAQATKTMGPICPVCRDVFGMMEGDQPDGKMTSHTSYVSLPGFPGCDTITINYHIYGGRQTEKHPHPGKFFGGISRTAYLPNNKEGNEVLRLLKKAFDQRLIFTVGTSRTTGMDDQVTWNDIHHKTNVSGGPQCFGYPDPDYLSRVKEELKAKGIE